MNYVYRQIEDRLKNVFTTFSVVSILGARQVGKTMLAHHVFPDWAHFDLERVDHFDRVSLDLEFFFQSETKNICFDEAQRLPSLFSHLRTIVDRFPERRFLLLGSAHPKLLKSISESLAGRSASIELCPFSLNELEPVNVNDLWCYGGYPKLQQLKDSQRYAWLGEYIHSFLERDIPALGISISSLRLRRLLQMLAHYHGKILNVNELASSLSSSTTAIYDALDVLEHAFIIRRLQPLHANLKKRLVKAPKIYIRDSGILHHLLRIPKLDDLFNIANIGASWEGFVIEQVIIDLQNRGISFEAHYFRTHAGAEVDLILDVAGRRLLLEVKLGSVTDKRSLKSLKEAIHDLDAAAAWIITHSGESYPVDDRIYQFPLKMALDQLKKNPS